MGGVASRAGRKVSRSWNVENRARKVIDKMESDPQTHVQRVAPKHESTQKLLDDFKKDHPELLDAQKMKDDGLHERLKGMEVVPDKVGEIGGRKLPEDRESVFSPDFGYLEPPTITLGKCSIRQVLKFIDNHQQDPQTQTAETIASEYTLDPERVKNILRYYRMYEVQVPKAKDGTPFKFVDDAAQTFLPTGRKQLSDKEDSDKGK